MSEATGQDLLDIAIGSWNENKRKYQGFEYNVAVGQAKQGIERKRGGRRDRLTEARHQVDVLFTHSRSQTPQRLGTVASEAGGVSGFAGDASELTAFASEVTELLNGPLSGGFGIIDPTMIIGLIQAIIGAIAACKKPIVPPKPVTP